MYHPNIAAFVAITYHFVVFVMVVVVGCIITLILVGEL